MFITTLIFRDKNYIDNIVAWKASIKGCHALVRKLFQECFTLGEWYAFTIKLYRDLYLTIPWNPG